MNRVTLLLLLGLLPLLAPVFAADGEDRTVTVASEDAEMNAAIAKARELLPHFWKTFEAPKRGESKFCLKLRITDKNGAEHFWLSNIERKDGKIKGTIDNDPTIVKSVKNGQRVEVPEADISDWLYLREEKMVGCYTLRAMFKKMPPAEVEEYKKKLAEP